jgi:hypothetical protein
MRKRRGEGRDQGQKPRVRVVCPRRRWLWPKR